MLPKDYGSHQILVEPISLMRATQILTDGNFVSAIGHEDTAKLLTVILGIEVNTNRVSIVLDHDTELIVAQYSGSRLPDGAEIRFFNISLPRHYSGFGIDSNRTYEESCV